MSSQLPPQLSDIPMLSSISTQLEIEEAKIRLPPPTARGHSGKLFLEQLIAEAQPLIRRRLRQKGIEGEVLEDLCVESIERYITAIQRREAREEGDLEHPGRYALSVTDTVFDDHLRRIRPNWYRLKRRILYLLDSTKAKGLFSRWKNRSAWIGGFARWTEDPFRPNARYHAFCARPALFCRQELHEVQPSELPLPTLMAHFFRWLGTPLEVDELTTHLADLQNIRDADTLSLEDIAAQNDRDTDQLLPPSCEDVADRVLDAIQSESFRADLWVIICALPVRQRQALLLGMSSDELLMMEASQAISNTLEMPQTQLIDLWPELPLTDSQIAQRLDCTPKQVSNLRKCARERIGRHLKL